MIIPTLQNPPGRGGQQSTPGQNELWFPARAGTFFVLHILKITFTSVSMASAMDFCRSSSVIYVFDAISLVLISVQDMDAGRPGGGRPLR